MWLFTIGHSLGRMETCFGLAPQGARTKTHLKSRFCAILKKTGRDVKNCLCRPKQSPTGKVVPLQLLPDERRHRLKLGFHLQQPAVCAQAPAVGERLPGAHWPRLLGVPRYARSRQASDSHLDLIRAPYVLYGVKYIDLVSLSLKKYEASPSQIVR